MILTTNLINTTVLKAYYSLALKSIKYYTGLALGKNNICLFKEMSLLRVYIDILKNFKIVGSEISCCCEIEGDYNTVLNNISDITVSPIQFNCDGTGYMLFNNDPYIFTYSYDEAHQVLMIEFNTPSIIYTTTFDVVDSGFTEPYAVTLDSNLIYSNTLTTFNNFISEFNATNQYGITLIDTGSSIVATSEFGFVRRDLSIIQGLYEAFITETTTLGDNITETFNFVSFNEACSINAGTYSPYQPISPLKVTTLDVTGDGLQNEDYTITITDQFDNPITTQTFSGEYLIDPEAVTIQWNLQYGFASSWLMTYNGSEYVFTSPFTGINYEGYKISFSQSEGIATPGTKASATGTVILVANAAYYQVFINNSLTGNATVVPGSTADSITSALAGSMIGYGYTSTVVNNSLTLFAPTIGTTLNGLPFQIKVVTHEILPSVTFCVLTGAENGDTVNLTINTPTPKVMPTYGASSTQLTAEVAEDLRKNISTVCAPFTVNRNGSCVTITAPAGSGSTYNGTTVTITQTGTVNVSPLDLTFSGGIPVIESFISYDLFEGGSDDNGGPSIITYNSVFEEVGSTYPFSNRKPCITRCNEASINITETPVPYYDDLVRLSILSPFGNSIYSAIYSAVYPITMTLQEIVDAWNADPNTVLYPATLNGTTISFKSCLPKLFGYNYRAELVQYEGGSNATTTLLINSSVLPSSGPFVISDTLNGPIYNSTTSFDTIEELITDFNDTNLGGYYKATYVGPEIGPEVLATATNNRFITETITPGQTYEARVNFGSLAPLGFPSILYLGNYLVQPGDNIYTFTSNLFTNMAVGLGVSGTVARLILTTAGGVGDLLNIGINSNSIFTGGPLVSPGYANISDAAIAIKNLIISSGGMAYANSNVPGEIIVKVATTTNNSLLEVIFSTGSWAFEADFDFFTTTYTTYATMYEGSGSDTITLEAFPGTGADWNSNVTFEVGYRETGIFYPADFLGGVDPAPNGNSYVEFSVQGEQYNTIDLTYDYNSGSYIDTDTLSGAVNPDRVEYINNFILCTEQPGSCISTTIEQTCLSNDEVKKIINNVNKIIK
jgi:hypothetical protein